MMNLSIERITHATGLKSLFGSVFVCLVLLFNVGVGHAQSLPASALAGCSKSGSTYTCNNDLSYPDGTSFTLTANTIINGNSNLTIGKNFRVDANGFTLTMNIKYDVKIGDGAAITGNITTTDGKLEVGKNSSITGNVSAKYDVKLDQSTAITGNVTTSAGKLDIGKDAAITGNISAAYDVKIDQSAAIIGNITTTAGKLDVGKDANITGNISAKWDVKIDQNAAITGNVTTTSGKLDVGNNGSITGNISALYDVKLGSGTVVNGACNNPPTGGGSCTGAKANQTITFGAQTTPKTYSSGGTFTINPTATASSGLTVTYSSTTTSICTVSGTTVTMVSAGTCTIAANQAGNASYNAATQVTQSVVLSSCTCPPQNGNLISNPSFEQLCATNIIEVFNNIEGGTVNMRNGVCGWNMNGAGMETWENTTLKPASNGTTFVEIDGYSNTVDCLWQNISTTLGVGYTLKVDYRARTALKEGLIVKWNGTQKYSTTAATTSAWTTITVSGLTGSGNDRIEFCEPSASNDAYGSWIDNVRIQAFFPDHYEVSVPASNIACEPSTVKVTVCADSSSPCINPLAVSTSPSATLATSAGTLASGTLTFGTSGIVSTTLSYPAATNGGIATLTLAGESIPGANARTCCIGSSCSVSNTCAATFNAFGFIFANSATGASATLPTQTAGTTSATTYLRAVQSSTSTGACIAALTGAQVVNMAYQCNNPATCSGANLMSVNGGTSTTIQRNNNTGVTSYTPVNVTFDGNGSAPFTYNFGDVGQVTLSAQKAASGSLTTALSGNSNPFVVKPGGFVLSDIKCTTHGASSCAPTLSTPGNNPAAASASGQAFIQAGQSFSATVTATTSGGTTTPNYGQEASAEGVKLTSALVSGLGLSTNPTLINDTAFGAFTSGVATGTTFKWDEVGIITLTPSIGDSDYLGAGDVTGTASANVGRFIPAYFETTVTGPMSCSGLSFTTACPSSNYLAYSGQPITPVKVSAYTTGGSGASGITQNYSGSFAKGITITPVTAAGGAAISATVGSIPASAPASSAVLATSFVAGVATLPFTGTPTDDAIQFNFTNRLTAPTNVYLRAAESSGGDSVTSSLVEDGFKVVSGRIQATNASGSEMLPLSVPVQAQFYNDSGLWATNIADGVSTWTSSITGSTNLLGTNAAGSTILAGSGPVSGGIDSLMASFPGAGSKGYVDITLSVPDYLKFNWGGGGAINPSARISFGLYNPPGNAKKIIHRREVR